VRTRTLAATAVIGAVCVGLTALVAWALSWPFERAAYLAPVIVAAAGAVAGLFVLWTRIALESLRQAQHPRRIVVLSVAALALLVGLSILGIKLPRE
jgi:hypothetical protein